MRNSDNVYHIALGTVEEWVRISLYFTELNILRYAYSNYKSIFPAEYICPGKKRVKYFAKFQKNLIYET